MPLSRGWPVPDYRSKDNQGYAYLNVGDQLYKQLGTLLDAWLNLRVERRVVQG